MLNDILLRLAGVKYFKGIDTSPEYHSLKLSEKSSHLLTFSCPFGSYQYIILPFGTAPGSNMTYVMFLTLHIF